LTTAKNPVQITLKNPVLSKLINTILGMPPLTGIYDRWLEKAVESFRPDGEAGNEGEVFLDHVLGDLDASIQVIHEERLQDIPAVGPFIAFANHPFGGLEGMQVARLLLKSRPDLKVLTNEILTLIPEFKDLFIGVDVLSTNSTQKNIAGMKKVTAHLRQGGALFIFPAGTVASFDVKERAIIEKPWTIMLGRLIRKYQASCMSIHIEGRNSLGFYLLGLIHKRLRTALLARELANKKGKCTTMVVGTLLKQKELKQFSDDNLLTQFLRLNCEALRLKNKDPRPAHAHFENIPGGETHRFDLSETLESLEDCLLLSKPPYKVYCAPYQRMGPLVHELARVREMTFRAAGEGTGMVEDSDRFDPHYLHLFVWDVECNKLVGSYRMGKCDEIIASHGVKGLYSRSLFKYKQEYIERLGGAVEVGRSFISPDYQRNPRALDILWQGIGTFIAKNPKYHTLFGCVSISSEHSVLARALLSDTMLTSFAAAPEFLTDIKPVSPFKVKGKLWTTTMLAALSDVAVINKLIGNFDSGKSVPVLLRHYLALNGRFVSFSVNHGFNQALDGLILVDLRHSPLKYLQRYLGHEGSEQFLAKWNVNEAAA
jgi:putative hemolysin